MKELIFPVFKNKLFESTTFLPRGNVLLRNILVLNVPVSFSVLIYFY